AFVEQLDSESARRIHLQIAQAIESLYGVVPDKLDAHNEILAYHYQQAGVLDRACHYYMQAGQRVMRLGNYAEARVRYLAALETLSALPDTPKHRRSKIDALLPLIQTSVLIDKKEENVRRLEEAQALLDGLQEADGAIAEDRLRMARIHSLHGQIHY